jgi:hypothetical protein
MTNETLIIIVVIESVAILGAFFLHRRLTSIPKPPQDDPERLMEKIMESQRNAARRTASETRKLLKECQTSLRRYMSGFTGGYISFIMLDSGKPFLEDLLKGFGEYAKLRGYEFTFLIDRPFLTDEVTFKFILDPIDREDRPPQMHQDLQDYLNIVEKRGSLDDLPVVPLAGVRLRSAIYMKNGQLYTNISRCTLLNHWEKFHSEMAANGDGKFPDNNPG